MGRNPYSRDLCRSLMERIRGMRLWVPYRMRRYEDGDTLDLQITTAWPEHNGKAQFFIEKFVGGGFAGQVYRCRLEWIKFDDDSVESSMRVGERYAVKILIPPSRFSTRFRDAIYKLGFQAPFSARVLKPACRSGLLWPKVLRLAAGEVFGDQDAVADTYASFFDENFRAYGEVREWVEGRTWRLESDTDLRKRRLWRTIDPHETESPEYIAKHQFMVKLVEMLREMGAPELARQYEWSTMKSQPNALKRASGGTDPAAGLCAVDFRAGLALLPYLPMSPGDFRLIIDGFRRRSLVQFDRCDFGKLRAYAQARPQIFGKHSDLIDALENYDVKYRRSMPDISHQGMQLLKDSSLRNDVRLGLIAGYWADGLIDDVMADLLEESWVRFTVFLLLGGIPIFGRFIRKLWGNQSFRAHVSGLLSTGYFSRASRAMAASAAVDWHRAGRVGETHARLIADHVSLFWVERLTVALLPGVLHKTICEPWRVWYRLRDGFLYVRRFFNDSEFREEWLREQVEDGYREGMLHEDERDAILEKIKDPYIVQYLKSVGVHLATLPVTQIVSVIVGAIFAAKVYATTGGDKLAAGKAFGGIVVLFQLIPISPGSICRGAYVVYLMIRDRNFKDYVVAAPLSFVKYIGYLAFPLQMATAYPAFSQFMASRWATSTVHIIPVFGEKGALLEHVMFDMFFNVPRVIGRLASKHIRGILDLWALLGLLLAAYVFGVRGVDWSQLEGIKVGVNVILCVLCVFTLPRLLFYPILHRRRSRSKE